MAGKLLSPNRWAKDWRMSETTSVSNLEEEWLEAWKTTEQVAMHFNELIMNFRLKAIGGITAAAGVFGTILLTKGDVATTAQNFRLFAAAAVLLLPVWLAVAYIDVAYYQRLLRGAVD